MRQLIAIPLLVAALSAGCDSIDESQTIGTADPVAASPAAVDISGDWVYAAEVQLVFPGFVAPEFGYAQEGPVLRLNCTASGTTSMVQEGSSYTSVSIQEQASCTTLGGQVGPAPWPPGPAIVEGTISGRSLHYASEPDEAGITCGGNGVIKAIAGGTATEVNLRGGCDLSAFPFRPAQAKNAYVLTRP